MAPAYHAPFVEIPDSYKEGPWLPAMPDDAQPRGAWWQAYHDDQLNQLETAVDAANPTLAAAAAAYDRSRAFEDQVESGLYPTLGFGGTLSDNRQSNNRPLRSKGQPTYFGANTIGLQAGYEVDLWGRVRNLVAAGKAERQASGADLETVRLSLHAELASDYAALRGFDEENRLLSETVTAYAKALQLTQTLYGGKIVSAIDVSRAQTQLDSARAQLSEATARRALLEHAIASLVGRPASAFSVVPLISTMTLPTVPTGIPSTLLQRRPDIAAAERRVATANQLIGVAEAAFYPNLSISAGWGLQDTGLHLLDLPNRFWSIGPAVSLPVFEGGLLNARLAAAKAEFDIAGADYRATVLRAFQEIEDNLSLLHWLQQEADQESAASAAAQRTLEMSLDQYRNGISSYLDVVAAQTAALDARRTVLTLQTRQFQANIGLIRALGGGWSGAMPKS